jgi:hypothetical protein
MALSIFVTANRGNLLSLFGRGKPAVFNVSKPRLPNCEVTFFARIARKSLGPSNIRDIRKFHRLASFEKLQATPESQLLIV